MFAVVDHRVIDGMPVALYFIGYFFDASCEASDLVGGPFPGSGGKFSSLRGDVRIVAGKRGSLVVGVGAGVAVFSPDKSGWGLKGWQVVIGPVWAGVYDCWLAACWVGSGGVGLFDGEVVDVVVDFYSEDVDFGESYQDL